MQTKEQRSKKMAEYYQKNKERIKLRTKSYQSRNKERHNRSSNEFYYRNKTYYFDKSHNIYTRNKEKLFIILGGKKCVQCGYDNPLGLQIDHIFSDGAHDRRTIGTSRELIIYYVKHPELAINKLQILCANCNQIKRHTHDEFRK